ncbi:MAG: penicillin acylase family protein [Rhodoferax sp.]|nr:penicillin acylase family protein [Rhodoferax sp.]
MARFLAANAVSDKAVEDHLLVRANESPFWDDTRTPHKETKAETLAVALRDSIQLLEDELGQDRSQWQWGKLHTYHWQIEATSNKQTTPFH